MLQSLQSLETSQRTVACMLEFASTELDPDEPTPVPNETLTVELSREPSPEELAQIKAEAQWHGFQLVEVNQVGAVDEF